MRDYAKETELRVKWIQEALADAGAKGIIFGNSGGKDSALVGILCRRATEHTLGVIMPCASKQNFGTDMDDAKLTAAQFGIQTITVDLTPVKTAFRGVLDATGTEISKLAETNINPRLRMTALYSLGQSLGYLVAGTGNASEAYMGYFTKWGDGAYDFNPIADLTVTEIFEFLHYLNAPISIREKAPSAGLYEGQTDEGELGVTYAAIDRYIATGEADPTDKEKIDRAHRATEHKRKDPKKYGVN